MGAGQIFNLPRTDDFSRCGKVPSHLTAKVVSAVAFQNKIKNLSCTHKNIHKASNILAKPTCLMPFLFFIKILKFVHHNEKTLCIVVLFCLYCVDK